MRKGRKLQSMIFLGFILFAVVFVFAVTAFAEDAEYDKLTTKKDTYLATESGGVAIGTDNPNTGALFSVYNNEGKTTTLQVSPGTVLISGGLFNMRDSEAKTILSVWNNGVFLPKKTDEEIKELSEVERGDGQLLYNTDKHSFVYWNGSEWRTLSEQQDEAKKIGSAKLAVYNNKALNADGPAGFSDLDGDLESGCPNSGESNCIKVKVDSGGGAYTLAWNYELKMDARPGEYVSLKLQTNGGAPGESWVTQDSSGELSDTETGDSACKDGSHSTHTGEDSAAKIVQVKFNDYYFNDNEGTGIKKREYFYVRLLAKKSSKNTSKLQAVLTGGYINVYQGIKSSDSTELTSNALASGFTWVKPKQCSTKEIAYDKFSGKDYISAESNGEAQAKKWCECKGEAYSGYENYITDKSKGKFEYKSTARGSCANYTTNGNCEKGCFDKVKCSK